MKTTWSQSVVLGTLLSFTVSAAPPSGPSGPKIGFVSQDYDFGKVDSGMLVTHEFIFTNTGDQMLEVKDVRPSCGCTTAGAWDKQVDPGKVGKISIQFNSGGYGGPVHKSISVLCNDPGRPTVTLGLQGTVWKAFDITPSYTVFNLLPEGQTNETQVIHIVSNNDSPVTVSDPACANPAFRTELKPMPGGKEFELRVTLVATNVSGSLSAPITMKTSSAKMPLVSLTAFAMVQPLLAVNPPQVTLPAGPLSNAVQFTVTIQNNGTNPITLSQPAINARDATARLMELQPGRIFNLVLRFPAGFIDPSVPNIEATVHTSHPQKPLVSIPVFQPAPPLPIVVPDPPTSSAAPAIASVATPPKK